MLVADASRRTVNPGGERGARALVTRPHPLPYQRARSRHLHLLSVYFKDQLPSSSLAACADSCGRGEGCACWSLLTIQYEHLDR